MRIRLEHNGTAFEFERKPMSECRFKVLCGLAAAVAYAGMVATVAALCGAFGLLLVVVGTVFVLLIYKGLD